MNPINAMNATNSINPRRPIKKPAWIKGKISWHGNTKKVKALLKDLNLESVCTSAACPNKGECWEKRHVTFMILGKICTRDCRFCDIADGTPQIPDPAEPQKIAQAVKKLRLDRVVVTSVTRDDLPDKGADHFVETVKRIKSENPKVTVELLIPDLDANPELLRKIAFSGANTIGHNIEMAENLYHTIRPRSDYRRSLDVLSVLKSLRDEGANIQIKSSIMLGLGENENDILFTLKDLKETGADMVFMGQYLNPSRKHWPVKKYYAPEEFKSFEKAAKEMGFIAVSSGPMVRSSYLSHSS